MQKTIQTLTAKVMTLENKYRRLDEAYKNRCREIKVLEKRVVVLEKNKVTKPIAEMESEWMEEQVKWDGSFIRKGEQS